MADEPSYTHRGKTRRSVLAAAGVGAVGSLAGCLDSLEEGLGSGGDDSNLTIVTSESETGSYAASQGIASTVDTNADEISVEAQPSEGTEDNIGRLGRGEANIGMIQHRSAQLIMDGEEPYGDLDYEPQQILHYHDLPWLFVTNHEDWTSIEDIEDGARISPTPGQSGTRDVLVDALDYVLDDYEVISVGYGEQAGAMQEGQLDVAVVTISNFDFEASWIQEMKQTVDTRVLEWPDDVAEELEGDEEIPVESIDMTRDNLDGYEQTPDEALGINIPYNFVVRDDLEDDHVTEFLETLYEHREDMEDDHAYLGYYMEDEWWTTRMYDDFPVHPAAAEFYQEIDVWDEDFVVGD